MENASYPALHSVLADSAPGLAAKWSNPEDPLIIDLDGDGIETIALADSRVFFGIDGDLFAERTGWVGRDDGLLAIDANGNGVIAARQRRAANDNDAWRAVSFSCVAGAS